MTNTGMFEDAERIEYLENQNKLLRKKLKERNGGIDPDFKINPEHLDHLIDKINENDDAELPLSKDD